MTIPEPIVEAVEQSRASSEQPLPLDELLLHMARAREVDRREGILFRQGKGAFQMPGTGHEAVAAAAWALRADDFLFPYYRDRALMLARGISVYEMALDFFGKAQSSSAGRQLAGFHSSPALKMISYAAPTGLQCLPAAGCAWACQRYGRGQVTYFSIGEAAVRQGDFYEALCFALEKRLPLVLAVEDNGYGISTPTDNMNPWRIGALDRGCLREVDGRDAEAVFEAACGAVENARQGGGPQVLWMRVDRLSSHSASDDHRLYRSAADIMAMNVRDPLHALRRRLMNDQAWEKLEQRIAREVEEDYRRAMSAADPDPARVLEHVFSPSPLPAHSSTVATRSIHEDGNAEGASGNNAPTMVQALNDTFASLLQQDERILMFGEDIEDPKGGVFGLTKGLSNRFGNRVVNSPLAEATIAGVACGLAIAGFVPVFELQFIDFVGPAFNQIVNQIATLRWRSAGTFQCPMVLYAPCGAYLPGGGPWHSQTNESWFAQSPGIQVVMPSNAQDAAALLGASVAGEDPVLFLIPKHLLRDRQPSRPNLPVRLGEAAIRRTGVDATVVAWGNCVEVALAAATALESENVDVEVIDLRSIVPCDYRTILKSLARTGRMVVVQEANRTCSFGQAIIAEIVSRAESWNMLAGPPLLVSRGDVHVGYQRALEYGVLPSAENVAQAIRTLMSW